MEIDWQMVWGNLHDAVLWAVHNGALFLTSLAGAAIGYFLYKFPESARIRRRLQSLFPSQRGAALARLHFAVIILAGTIVATIIIQPVNQKEALLAGFTWFSALNALMPKPEAKVQPGRNNG